MRAHYLDALEDLRKHCPRGDNRLVQPLRFAQGLNEKALRRYKVPPPAARQIIKNKIKQRIIAGVTHTLQAAGGVREIDKERSKAYLQKFNMKRRNMGHLAC